MHRKNRNESSALSRRKLLLLNARLSRVSRNREAEIKTPKFRSIYRQRIGDRNNNNSTNPSQSRLKENNFQLLNTSKTQHNDGNFENLFPSLRPKIVQQAADTNTDITINSKKRAEANGTILRQTMFESSGDKNVYDKSTGTKRMDTLADQLKALNERNTGSSVNTESIINQTDEIKQQLRLINNVNSLPTTLVENSNRTAELKSTTEFSTNLERVAATTPYVNLVNYTTTQNAKFIVFIRSRKKQENVDRSGLRSRFSNIRRRDPLIRSRTSTSRRIQPSSTTPIIPPSVKFVKPFIPKPATKSMKPKEDNIKIQTTSERLTKIVELTTDISSTEEPALITTRRPIILTTPRNIIKTTTTASTTRITPSVQNGFTKLHTT